MSGIVRNVRLFFLAAALVGGAAGLCLPAVARESDELRERFRAAYLEAVTGAVLSDEHDDDELRDYPIYSWLEAARIAKALSLVDATTAPVWEARASDFLDRHDGQPVAVSVARAGLQSLARRGETAAFIAAFRPSLADERMHCQWLSARIDSGATAGLEPLILERWLTPAQLPTECEPAFQWLRDAGTLDADWTARRVRLLIDNGQAAFARVVARRLPSEQAGPLLLLADLVDTPRAAIEGLIADPALPVEFDALLAAFTRLATANPAAGIDDAEKLIAARQLDPQQASRVERAVAYGLAWDRDPRALDHFARVAATELDDYTLEWRARSALWTGDWALVAASIDALSPPKQRDSAWQYWAGRAAAALGDAARARAQFEAVLRSDNFYSALAAARLDRDVVPHAERFAVDRDIQRELERLEPLIRARELRAVALPAESLAEWRHGLASLPPAVQQQGIHLAADWGWYDIAIAAATNQSIFYDYELLYPRPFDKAVADAAGDFRLDEPLIYAVIRQESLYRPDAASAAGALGLMQLVPDTAARVARARGLPRPGRDALFDPATNITLGAAELRRLIDRFNGQLAPALAAYNAGPGAVDRWLPDEPIDLDIWVENIPYNETRAYVRRVLWHGLVFQWLDDKDPADTRPWLSQVHQIAAANP